MIFGEIIDMFEVLSELKELKELENPRFLIFSEEIESNQFA